MTCLLAPQNKPPAVLFPLCDSGLFPPAGCVFKTARGRERTDWDVVSVEPISSGFNPMDTEDCGQISLDIHVFFSRNQKNDVGIPSEGGLEPLSLFVMLSVMRLMLCLRAPAGLLCSCVTVCSATQDPDEVSRHASAQLFLPNH